MNQFPCPGVIGRDNIGAKNPGMAGSHTVGALSTDFNGRGAGRCRLRLCFCMGFQTSIVAGEYPWYSVSRT